MNQTPDLDRLTREAETAMEEARRRVHLHRGWQALHETDEQGVKHGPLPYTDEAIREFELALARDPDNHHIIHHLAICTHARAWDMELQGHPAAAGEWQKGLDYWRQLINAPGFWQELADKMAACKPDEDTGFVRELRNSLYEQLLDIHIDFIRFAMEKNIPARAADHIAIIRGARIPPVVRKRMDDKLFAAMTGTVPRLRAGLDFEPALDMVEQFMKLIDAHLPALQLHLEICAQWLDTLSCLDDWEQMSRIAERARPVAQALAGHPLLAGALLARQALEDLAVSLLRNGLNRCNPYDQLLRRNGFAQHVYDQAATALDLAIQWGRLALDRCPATSELRPILAAALNARAVLIGNHEMEEVWESSSVDMATKLETSVSLCKKCISLLEEATGLDPGDSTLDTNLKQFRAKLEELEQLSILVGLQQIVAE